jgi:hypothetical protein
MEDKKDKVCKRIRNMRVRSFKALRERAESLDALAPPECSSLVGLINDIAMEWEYFTAALAGISRKEYTGWRQKNG